MCGAKMVHLFAVSSVVRGYHKYKDVGVLLLTEQNFLVKENQEPGNPRDISIVAITEQNPSGEPTLRPWLCSSTNFSYLLNVHSLW